MSRPKPEIIIVSPILHGKYQEIVKASNVFVVCYEGEPIGLRESQYGNPTSQRKYKKTAFTNPGHAFHLAGKLNRRFETKKFSVRVSRELDETTEAEWRGK